MKLNLLSREINIILKDKNSLGQEFSGIVEYEISQITIARSNNMADQFSVLMHELGHFYFYTAGQQQEMMEVERCMNAFGALTTQLIIENGPGIFAKLWRYCEKS